MIVDLVVPIFNEGRYLRKFLAEAVRARRALGDGVRLNYIFVDRGSGDGSLELLFRKAEKHRYIKIVSLTRDFGFQRAALAGMEFSKGEIVGVCRLSGFSIRRVLRLMLDKVEEGNDIVYGSSLVSYKKSLIRTIVGGIYYGFLRKVSGMDLSHEFESIVLMKKSVVEAAKKIWKRGLHIFSSLNWVGYRTGYVYFRIDDQEADRRVDLKQKWRLLGDVIFSFSDVPLRMAINLGTVIVGLALMAGLLIVYLRFFTPYSVPGISAVIMAVLMMGGVQIMILGIIGRYIGSVFADSSDIPAYVVGGVKNIPGSEDTLMTLERADVLQKEESFHDDWADAVKIENVMVDEFFNACTAPENRFIMSRIGEVKSKKILEIGCGLGEASVYFAKNGAKVVASDISGEMIGLAKKVAEYHKVGLEVCKCSSIKIPFGDQEFDIVYAANVLHHVNLEATLREVSRVLKKGGIFACWDPLAHNVAINIYRRKAMKVRTEDEHPIKWNQLEAFRKNFSEVEVKTTWLTTLWIFVKFYFIDRVDPNKERYWKKILLEADRLEKIYYRLEKIDDFILKYLPFVRRYCWNMVVARK